MGARFFSIFVALMLAVVVGTAAAGAARNGQTVRDESLRMGETGATLDPGQFSDAKVREAYQAARDIPWVLDSIHCFCYCKESPAFKHKSLLSCYVDNHAAG